MRKYVECTFGMLKGRWRIIKSGIRFHGVDVADDVWMACCALHNTLPEDGRWTVDWSGFDSEFDYEESSDTVLFVLQRLSNYSLRRTCDIPCMGCVDATDEDTDVLPPVPLVNNHMLSDVSVNGIDNVHQLTCNLFRKTLIENFDLLFK